MYIRTIRRKNKDGSVVEYVQLAHNVRDKDKGYAKAEVIHSFGRKDQLDIEAIRRLIKSMCRLFPQDEAARIEHDDNTLKLISSRPAGGAWVLRQLWNRLGIDACLDKAIASRSFTAPMKEAIFAMVANRALAPSSKRAIEHWAAEDVYLGEHRPLQPQHFYRSMDVLLEHAEAIQKEVFWATASLLNLTVDLIFFDTTNTYFEIDDPGESKLKAYGKSKQKRDDLPQITIGLAVTRKGIPVRCWVLPGNQHDSQCVKQVQRDLNSWNLGRVVWVMDRGMTSESNRQVLQKAGGQYIFGEKLSGSKLSKEAMSRPGRFKEISSTLRIKEVFIDEGGSQKRYVVVHNPKQEELDRATRERLLERLSAELDTLNARGTCKQRCRIKLHPSMGRYVKELKSGQMRINMAKVRQDEKLDGKYLLSTSDRHLSAEDIALGYKQLLEVEQAFRTLKTTLELRPVYHSRDDRIRSHILLCWLALLLVRVAEVETGRTWRHIRRHMQQQNLVDLFGANGRILQHTEPTPEQRNILKKLNIKAPGRIVKIETTG